MKVNGNSQTYIDDLGRVVIPKEIRRTMRIREGAPLEIFTNKDGEVIFKKVFSDREKSANTWMLYAETVNKGTANTAVIFGQRFDTCGIGEKKRQLADKKISPEIEKKMLEERRTYVYKIGRYQNTCIRRRGKLPCGNSMSADS